LKFDPKFDDENGENEDDGVSIALPSREEYEGYAKISEDRQGG
jgi:hypothetical protein